MADVIDDLIAELRAEFPEVRQDRVLRFEVMLRDRWGGERPYVSRHPGKKNAWGLGTSLSVGMTLDQAFEAVGVSRRWGQALLLRRLR